VAFAQPFFDYCGSKVKFCLGALPAMTSVLGAAPSSPIIASAFSVMRLLHTSTLKYPTERLLLASVVSFFFCKASAALCLCISSKPS
jgi:hypothetical protein